MTACALIFDCDGTLVDSEDIGNEVLAAMVSGHGYTLTPQKALEQFRGMNLAECLGQIERESGRPLPESFVPMLRQRTAEAFREKLRPVSGAVELVRSLPIPFCVASSGPREKIELSLALTGLLPFFRGRVFSSYEIGSWKPEPGLFLHAAQALGVRPASCIVVEDSLPGIQAGLAAGMNVIAFQPRLVDPRIPVGVTVIRHLVQLLPIIAASGVDDAVGRAVPVVDAQPDSPG